MSPKAFRRSRHKRARHSSPKRGVAKKQRRTSMGNCLPPKPIKVDSQPASEPLLGGSPPESSSPPYTRVHHRRRLSLFHSDPVTSRAADEPARGATGRLFFDEVKEPRPSLETVLAQNVSGTRVSIMGAVSHRTQSYFENKNETLLGNRSTSDLNLIGIGHACRKGLKPESPNQDDFFIFHLEHVGLYGVFDGHGPFGHDVSNFVQQRLPKHIYNHELFRSNTSAALRSAFSKIQEEIVKASERHDFDASLSGTTATVIVHDMMQTKLYVAHVGDSRAVLAKYNGDKLTAIDLTQDHKPTLELEKQRIDATGGEVKRLDNDIPHRVFLKGRLFPGLAMSRALGDLVALTAGVSPEPEITEWTINSDEDQFITICSDGVWEFISSQQAVDMISRFPEKETQTAAENLAKESWNKWIEVEEDVVDDITVEIIYLFPTSRT